MTDPYNWKARHDAAMQAPRKDERVHVAMVRAVQQAVAAGWAEDGYASDHVVELCRAARALLNMETGRLDCGTLDTYYCKVLRMCGEEP
jgi:hypothetical protein